MGEGTQFLPCGRDRWKLASASLTLVPRLPSPGYLSLFVSRREKPGDEAMHQLR